MRKHLFLWLLLAVLSTSYAQDSPCVSGELLVMLESTAPEKVLARPFQGANSLTYPQVKKCISPALSIFLLSFDQSELDETEALSQLRQWEGVRYAQLNHKLEHRALNTTIPNDPNFLGQWPLENIGQNNGTVDADIAATEAWDITTGGLTVQGDTIVVAVIDQGMDLNHEDLNLWRNHAEIPDNGIDDDGNGFTDDYLGWNANQDNDEIPLDIHGTPVAGIIAAQGDNGKGIAGVSWNTQIMTLVNILAVEAEVVEAYSYVLEMRRRYNQSGGAEGAFVVATNSSFGVDFGNPANFPIWCAIYDSLGAQGVINVAATTNAARNVDVQNDMPSGCISDFLITVTNTNNQDVLNTGAGFGANNVDLGAPGTQIPSTRENDTYGSYSGTSFSTPYVSGTVALLFSAACTEILTQYKLTPENMALEFKSWILDGVDLLPSLNGKTLSGGRLNAYNSLLLQQGDCSNFNLDCLAPDMLEVSNLTDVSALLSWANIDSAENYSFRYRESSASIWTDSVLSDTFLQLDLLTPCTDYIFQVSANCTDDSSGFLASRRFRTEGCCEAAPGFSITELDSTEVSLVWQDVFGANAYILQFREEGQQNWNEEIINDTNFLLDNLNPCTLYELRLGTDCGNPDTNFTQILQIQSPGCGFCLDTEYCTSRANVTQFEWIEAVKIGPIQNVSGSNGGYAEFSDASYILAEDSTYEITLEHGFVGLAGRQHWRIWIDANQDGQFASDDSELFFATDLPIDGEFSDSLKTPAAILSGNTRMRISMKFEGTLNPELPPSECETFEFGEVEDYCIQILPKGSVSRTPLFNPPFLKVYPNPFQNQLVIESEEAVLDWQLFDVQGRLVREEGNLRNYERLLNLGDLPSGIYYLKIHTENGTSSKKILKY